MRNELTIEELLERAHKGNAYRRITAQMGPSLDLVAFVNYDQVTADSLGIESLNVMEMHEQILKDIDADPSLNMAVESFLGRTKSILTRVKNVITFNKHAKDLSRFTKGKLTPKANSIYVEKPGDFNNALNAHKKLLPLLSWVVQQLPKTGELKVWEEFAKKHVMLGGQSEFDKKIREIQALSNQFKSYWKVESVDFAESGWTAESFKAAVTNYLAEAKKTESDYTLTGEIADDLYTLIRQTEELNISSVSTSDTDTGEKHEDGSSKTTSTTTVNYSKREDVTLALKAMNKAQNGMSVAYEACFKAEVMMDKTLRHVAHHFDVA